MDNGKRLWWWESVRTNFDSVCFCFRAFPHHYSHFYVLPHPYTQQQHEQLKQWIEWQGNMHTHRIEQRNHNLIQQHNHHRNTHNQQTHHIKEQGN